MLRPLSYHAAGGAQTCASLVLHSRDPPGNLARTDSAELEATPYQEPRDSPVTAAAAAAVAPLQTVPRKRGRKANKDRRSTKRRRSQEPEEPAQMRVTRAAIRAEEEAQDTMDVLSALAGTLLTECPVSELVARAPCLESKWDWLQGAAGFLSSMAETGRQSADTAASATCISPSLGRQMQRALLLHSASASYLSCHTHSVSSHSHDFPLCQAWRIWWSLMPTAEGMASGQRRGGPPRSQRVGLTATILAMPAGRHHEPPLWAFLACWAVCSTAG